MINEASGKSALVRWCLGNVMAPPFSSGAFSGVMCILAIHHFDDLLPIFQEDYRALGRGRSVIPTATPVPMQCYWLNEYFPDALV